ncbi:MAG: acyl carrier protein, partial [Pseudobdellovibrionaceae bacterium]|nr:acyl carrier protein [Pseudobdellovibrionaceae bacterium]
LEPRSIESRDAPVLRPSKASGPMASPAPVTVPTPWLKKLMASLTQISGLESRELQPEASWVSLGLDSLLLTQWSLKMQKEWGINMNVNMLQNELQNLQALATHLQSLLPQDMPAPGLAPAPVPAPAVTAPMTVSPHLSTPAPMDAQTISALLQQQMVLMSKQIELLTGLVGQQTQAQRPASVAPSVKSETAPESPSPAPEPLAAVPIKSPTEPLPGFLNRLVHEGEIEFANDEGVLRMPRYRGAFLALDSDGQPGLFIENPDQSGEYWQVVGE